jgi:HK97 family phage major capsid protein
MEMTMSDFPPLEIKAVTDSLGAAQLQFQNAVNASAQDSDPLLAQTVDKLSGEITELKSRLDHLHRAAQRPVLARTAHTEASAGLAHKAAFLDQYVRRGLEGGLLGLEQKALNITAPADGGYAVPESLDAVIDSKLRDISPIRAVANVVQVGSADYKKLIAISGVASGWVAENAPRPETASPTFAEIATPMGELYANPAATQTMLDDAMFNVEQWLGDEIATEFAQKEGAAFVAGNGTAKPKGFLSYTVAATPDTTRAFGTLQYVPTTTAGAFPASNPADKLIDLVHALRPAYRQGASFVMNSKTLSVIRKFKDGQGQFIWQSSLAEGRPDLLLGYPVVEAEDMPDIGTDSLSIAFGNFQRGYVIADRGQVRLLRDPYSNKPFVHFYATRRTGGAVVNSEAIKLMKFGVS